MEKICSKCGEFKPATTEFFYSNKRAKSGLMAQCKCCFNKLTKAYQDKNADKKRARERARYVENIEKHKERVRQYKKANAQKESNYKKSRYARDYELRKERQKKCPVFAMKIRMREAIKRAAEKARAKPTSKLSEILGCTYQEFAKHIESQFVDGMRWDNRSEWHIDHKIPLATAKTEEDVIRLNHYTNLRPLWAIDNLRKGANLDF